MKIQVKSIFKKVSIAILSFLMVFTSITPFFKIDKVEAYSQPKTIAGAVYGVYTDANATNKVGEFVTDENGDTKAVTLAEDRYYVKELKAPKGYKLDTRIYPVDVKGAETKVFNVADEPLFDPLSLIIK